MARKGMMIASTCLITVGLLTIGFGAGVRLAGRAFQIWMK